MQSASALLAACLLTLGIASQARAQAQLAACPDAGADADSAEQVLCWAALESKQDARCAANGCDEQIVGHCKNAALDAAQVGHACFLAMVRTGDFASALGLAEYLQEPTPEVAQCLTALSGVVAVRVVTNPPGAVVEVDGVKYGAAPVVVNLKSHFWERQVRVAFDASKPPVAVTEEQLRAGFDARACAMGDVVVSNAETTATPPTAAAAPRPRPSRIEPTWRTPAAPTRTSHADVSAGGSSSLWIWTLAGTALTAGGAVTFRVIGDGQYADLKKSCAPTCSQRQVSDAGVETSDALMVTFGAVSGALLVTTLVLALSGNGDDDAANDTRLGIRGLGVAGAF